MKHTAKISIIIALALCISIGGVYAAWTYNVANLGTAEAYDSNAIIGLTHVVGTGETVPKGSIIVEHKIAKILIDQKQSYDLSHNIDTPAEDIFKAVLVWQDADGNETSNYVVKYNPIQGVGSTVEVPTTLVAEYEIKITSSNPDFSNTFTVPSTGEEAKIFNSDTLTWKGDLGTLEANGAGIPLSITTIVSLSGELELPTEDDYNAFKTYIGTMNIVVTISEKAA